MTMASERTITIRIVSDSASVEPSADAGGRKRSEAEKEKSKRTAAIQAISYLTTTQIVGTVKQYAEAGYGRYLDLTEDYKAGTARQNAMAHISRVTNVAASAIGGAVMGAKLGPLAAIIGAVVGIAGSIAKNELQRYQVLAEQTKSIHEEAYSLYFNTARAGMINYSRGTEN